MARPKTQDELRLDRIEKALVRLSGWVDESQPNFITTYQKGIKKILDGTDAENGGKVEDGESQSVG
jgi:hypothetical protein